VKYKAAKDLLTFSAAIFPAFDDLLFKEFKREQLVRMFWDDNFS